MLKKIKLPSVILLLLTVGILLLVGFKYRNTESPVKVYQVYLDGEKLGAIQDKDELFDLIDKTQNQIKDKFKVDKVYPPDGLETIANTTYNNRVKSANEIYNLIEDKSTFTIKGYVVSIKSDNAETKLINILHREDLEPALHDAIGAFVSPDKLDAYLGGTQVEITDVGEVIENVYLEETITVKESFLSTSDVIITNQSDLTKYLLFGTLEKQAEYTVKDGDTVETVAYNNRLSNEELLIANPQLSSVNSLLSPGKKLNIGLINPLFNVVSEVELIEDLTEKFKTVYEYDSNRYVGDNYTKQEGVNGLNRVTEQIQYKNGQIMTLVVSATTEIRSTVDKVVVKGTKVFNTYTPNYQPPDPTGTDWVWPTARPFVITSHYGYRWGKLHAGIDISGSGFGSPIYSATDGVVTAAYSGCANVGYYGNKCGGEYGNYVYVQTSTGYLIKYAHMKSNITVSVGTNVKKGQVIGYMGNSGSSTGTHLHFQINDLGGKSYNPCKEAFSC